MTTPTVPAFEIIGEPSDAAISALARLLLAAVEQDEADSSGQGDGTEGNNEMEAT